MGADEGHLEHEDYLRWYYKVLGGYEVDGDDVSTVEIERDSFEAWQRTDSVADMASWIGRPSVKGSTETMRMALLTFSLVGLQFTWGIEMTYCTPYLLALGLTKSRTSMVWIAGPLSGLIMQPIVGVISDRSKSKWGRRRPFMVIGSLIVALCLLVLGWTKEIVLYFVEEGDFQKSCTIALAVLSIYAVDFSINAVQSCCRSLIVDTLPAHKQQTGSAWASRMASMGHIIGYVTGTFDLVAIFGPSFGDTQFKKLTVLAAVGLIITSSVTSWAVTERVLVSDKSTPTSTGGIQIISQIFKATMQLPPRIQAICWVQFWSWIGWFPFLFYSTTWVGETYFRYDAPHDLLQSKDALGEIGRIGSMSLVLFSIVVFVGALLLPLFVRSPDEESFTARPPASIAGVVSKFTKHKPDLLTAWICGHLLFSVSMALAPFAHSYRMATTLVALCAVPWAIASWAPNAFLGVEVNKLSAPTGRYSRVRSRSRSRSPSPVSMRSLSPSASSMLHLEHGPSSPTTTAGEALDAGGSTGELSGMYFGILNIYTTLPQFIGTFISMFVFALLEPGKSPELSSDATAAPLTGVNAIAVCLFIGAMCNVGAAYATKRLGETK